MGDSRAGIPWSDLPQELVEKIAKCLDTETDVLRFRAVCNSWRSLTAPFQKFHPTLLRLPFPFAAGKTSHTKHDGPYLNLIERTVYRVELPDCKQPNFWLVKVEKLSNGKLRILNPVSNDQIRITPEIQMPKVLNTLDFRVYEVCKAYTLQYVNPSNPERDYKYAKKVIVKASIKNDEYVVIAIDASYDNKLWYINSGGEKWTMVPDNGGRRSNSYLDIVNIKGQVYGIDVRGGTWLFDSMFKATKIAYNILNCASERHVVEHLVELYNGELHLVEVDLAMYKRINICALHKHKRRWVEAKTVNDRIIFVGDDCSFSVSANESGGHNGARVFYTDWLVCPPQTRMNQNACSKYLESFPKSIELLGLYTGVFDCEIDKTRAAIIFPEYARIFWPPPAWLSRRS